MTYILRFDEPGSDDLALVGGKGANLGLLASGGFPVPPGFTITTVAHEAFAQSAELSARIDGLISQIDFADPGSAEDRTSEIRKLICELPIDPEIEAAITQAHSDLGSSVPVAVRSSGTAEDLAEASFAGMHDTFLDVSAADLLDAVRRCWASLWTGRAVTYRHTKGFDHQAVRLAVVVQTMVEADVAGVGFTGNPITADNDEIVIDASWGLGESVVSGMITPDQFVFKNERLYLKSFAHYGAVSRTAVGKAVRLKSKALGSKSQRIVRDPERGTGTIVEDVPEGDRGVFCLSDEDAKQVAELGLRVQRHYDGLPQDIEWAMAAGQVYLLQSRPITGVEFAWEEDLESWQTAPEPKGVVWTRMLADEAWTGAITPLMYSVRAELWSTSWHLGPMFTNDFELRRQRVIQYSKGTIYLNVDMEKSYTLDAPKLSRPGVVGRLPHDQIAEVLDSPWDMMKYLKTVLKYHLMLRGKWSSGKAVGATGGFWGHFTVLDDYLANHIEEAEGLPAAELRNLSDDELRHYIETQVLFEINYASDINTPGFLVYARDVLSLLGYIVSAWYDGDHSEAFLELISGTPEPTAALWENVELKHLAVELRARPELLDRFYAADDKSFFDIAAQSPEGADYLGLCQEFLDRNGHRGHADRDIYFPRYNDDWQLLYDAIAVLMKVDDDPMEHHHANNARRAEVVAEVTANLRRKPLGALRVELFNILLEWSLRFLAIRDNERHFVDRSTYSIRLGFIELNRRLIERGLITGEDDFWFLARGELYDILDGRDNPVLTRAKVAGRRANFDRFNAKEAKLPRFLKDGSDYEAGSSASVALADGRLGYQGMPISRGIAEGTARLVKAPSEIRSLHPGDIAIVHATDPGWTPIFTIVEGIVAETGGILSHCSSLSREHGLPAAQLEDALHLIPEGSRIRIDGNTGQIEILEEVTISATA